VKSASFFFGGDENELQRLFTDISRIREINQINNAFFENESRSPSPSASTEDPPSQSDPNWIGGLLFHLGVYSSLYNCSGFFHAFDDESEFAIQEDGGIEICINCAWGPLVEIFQLFADAYGQKYVFCAEEPNMGIYINTDISGQHFPDRFGLEWLVEGCIGEEKFSDEEQLIAVLADHNLFVDSFDDAEMILKDLNEKAEKEGKEAIGTVWKYRET